MDNFFTHLPGKMNDSRIFTDYRTSSTRELNNMTMNGIVNEHDYRKALQSSGSKIMDAEWTYLKQKNTKPQKICPHSYPLRASPGMLNEELTRYTEVFTGKSNNYPKCQNLCDYRLTQTPGSGKNCSELLS